MKATEKTQTTGAAPGSQMVTAQVLDTMLSILAVKSLTPHLWLEAAKKHGIDTLTFCQSVQLLHQVSLIRISGYSNGSGFYEFYSLTAKVPPR
jgi:hypothetical protein